MSRISISSTSTASSRRLFLRFNKCGQHGQSSASGIRAIYFTDAMPA
jgi:hypothetical protein